MKRYFTLILLSIFYGCKEPTSNRITKEPAKKELCEIVLIFKNPVENWKYTFENGAYLHHGKYEISYMDSSILPVYWSPIYSQEYDTLIISTDKSLEIKHKYRGLDEFSYLFAPGDTVLFSYAEKMPIARIHKKKQKEYDYSYDSLLRKKIFKNDFPAIKKYNFPIYYFKIKQNLSWEEADNWYIKNRANNIKKSYFLEKELLDSIQNNQLISAEQYQFYANRHFYENKRITLEEEKLDSLEIRHLFSAENHHLLMFSFYRDFVDAIVQKIYVENTELIRSSHGSTYDYRTVYDSIANSSLFPKKTKKYLLESCLEKVITNFSVADANTYYKKFNTQYQDPIVKRYLAEKYSLKDITSNQMELVDVNDQKKSFKEILETNKGKVIYVDYWASWCAPCRAAMPASHELRQKYKNKDIVFVYLALNDTEKLWKDAMEKDGLLGYNDSYLITNPKNSKMLNDLHIQAIPRYMIYDKSGKLVHKNASGPGSEKTIVLLNQYLAE